MSAIYGILGDGDLALLHAMGNNLVHRGVICHEWSPIPGLYLGYRGFNPSSCNSRGVIAANASIYNCEEIIRTIEQKVKLDGEKDICSLINVSFDAFGVDCFNIINGDFVLAIWDEKVKRLILARDRVGSRIVYYWVGKSYFAFASEYKSFMALPDFDPKPDLDSIQYLQSTKYLLPGKTLLAGVSSLPSAHWLEIKDYEVRLHRYWDILMRPQNISEDDAKFKLYNLFLRSVERRLSGVENIQAELSGGIDSSAVVAAIRKLRPDSPIQTYTIGAGKNDPEIVMAQLISEELKTDHHEIIVEAQELIQDLPDLVWYLEDPIGRTESYLYYKLMTISNKNGSCMFSGTASDGLFAGMPRHKIIRMIEYLPLARKPLEEFYFYTQTSCLPQTKVGKTLFRYYFGKGELPAPEINGAAGSCPHPRLPEGNQNLLNQVLRTGLLNSSPNSMAKVEKTHMAHGVEFRTPYTDIDFMNFSFSLSENLKMKGFKEKYILRKALLPLLPCEIAHRPKFPQSMEYNLQLSNTLDDLAESILNPKTIQTRGFFNYPDIERLRHRQIGKPYASSQSMRLWTAIVTELWAQIFLDRRGTPLS